MAVSKNAALAIAIAALFLVLSYCDEGLRHHIDIGGQVAAADTTAEEYSCLDTEDGCVKELTMPCTDEGCTQGELETSVCLEKCAFLKKKCAAIIAGCKLRCKKVPPHSTSSTDTVAAENNGGLETNICVQRCTFIKKRCKEIAASCLKRCKRGPKPKPKPKPKPGPKPKPKPKPKPGPKPKPKPKPGPSP